MRCQKDECTREGLICVPPGGEPLVEFYCVEHAHGAGYCWACGGFFAGIGSFEVSRDGLCDECYDETRDDFDEDFDDWEDFDDRIDVL